ncbi:biotin/lipoyl-binding protein [Ferrimonas lipolytica]|uniref:Biotin/lipoyl-binding protein n=1 Tax=Ferrimonas lipolytica TaxID=2724191 RepID=A0A6H1UL12_9GAMM|nr:efflux RND transporter periplasmic adaptor subunit [Ferrimonas lipolytica]QIZ78916.1 biotin/lipoyl-binding protein [Ferrimonas lipolytica]
MRNLVMGGVALVILAGLSLFALKQAYQPRPVIIQGQIEARQYQISSKAAGRIDSLSVRRGDVVQAGEELFRLDSPELEARFQQAQAGVNAAAAMQQQADTGARKQQIQAAQDDWQRAQAAEKLAAATFERIKVLYQEGVMAQQKRDEAYAQWQASLHQSSAAKALFDMASEGARVEERQAAKGQTDAAIAQLDEVKAVLADMQILAPRHAEVSAVMLHQGELVPRGFPVLTLTDMDDAWALFQVREDKLNQFADGAVVEVYLPALQQRFPFTVAYKAVQGDFATWRATESGRDFDLRTFEVELRPNVAIDGLRAGMTAIIEPI